MFDTSRQEGRTPLEFKVGGGTVSRDTLPGTCSAKMH